MLSRSPFVGIVFVYIMGIMAGAHFWPSLVFIPLLAQVMPLLMLLISGMAILLDHRKKVALFFALFLFHMGLLGSLIHMTRLNAQEVMLSGKPYTAYQAKIISMPESRTKVVRVEMEITRIFRDRHWIIADSKAICSIPLQSTYIPAQGDVILVNGTLKLPDTSRTPNAFDYRKYLRNRSIIWVDYLPEGTFYKLKTLRSHTNPVAWSTTVSTWADHTFRENIQDDEAYGLIKAMLLGRRDALGAEQVDNYISSGAVHILSVSGMHVAIIFLVISIALGWMKKWKMGQFLYVFTVIALLSFYALVTGLPPSVLRATLMCIIFVIAEVFGRKQNNMNTLAFSAFLILLFDPHALYDVGFQLSYLAMSGIFLLYEPIDRLVVASNPFLKYIWQLSALSFAAQLATFPLSLYYFHQFPVYFWLVNPFVIAFTNVLLPAALALLLASLTGLAWVQEAMNFIVSIAAYLTNYSVSVPGSLPGYLIENLYLDRIEILLLYAFIVAGWYAYHTRNFLYVKRSFAILMVFVVYSVSEIIQCYICLQNS